MRAFVFAALPAFAAGFGSVAKAECAEVAPALWAQIDFEEYTRATWYSQAQEPNSYQTVDELFCITAT